MAHSSEVTKTIVQKVAEYETASPDELPPLSEKIEPETFQQLTAIESQLTGPIDFKYLWYDVNVLADGEVIVTP